MAEEWGPWIEHDGLPRPDLLGKVAIVVTQNGRSEVGTIHNSDIPPPGYCSWWVWSSIPERLVGTKIVRYRLRRPSALRRLIDLAADPEKGLPPRFPVEELA